MTCPAGFFTRLLRFFGMRSDAQVREGHSLRFQTAATGAGGTVRVLSVELVLPLGTELSTRDLLAN